MRKVAVMCAALSSLAALCHATESAPLNEDFLEYLAELDTGNDNWTWFAAQEDLGNDDEKRATQPPTQQQERVKP